MMDIQKKALQIVAKISGKEAADLKAEHELVADLGIDSPKALQLLLDLEDELDIEISDDDAAGLDTVGDIIGYLENLAPA